jgi:16S rRNA (guanine527-N7)-methyltransferase
VSPDLDHRQEEALRRLGEELLRWNRRMNLTGHRQAAGVWDDLIADGLALAELVSGETLLDIGSGAGFPGLVLGVAVPGLEVTLLEPREKRVAFLHHMIRTLELGQRARAVRGRASAGRRGDPPMVAGRRYACVTLRAVAGLSESVELARPYLAPGGEALLPRGPADAEQARGLGLEAVAYEVPAGRRVAVRVRAETEGRDVSRET